MTIRSGLILSSAIIAALAITALGVSSMAQGKKASSGETATDQTAKFELAAETVRDEEIVKIASNEPVSYKASGLNADNQPKHIVELFTSQGCSSCPPANAFIGKIADQDSVLALTYGVTYWDYLGWKDTFGDPKFTKRQREYRPFLGASNVYTPQIILNGGDHSARYSQKDIVQARLSDDAPQSMFDLDNDKLVIDSDVPKGALLAVVSYRPGQQDVDVKRGENGGRVLSLTNVVTDIVKMPWDGGRQNLDITPKSGLAYAALFHNPKQGNIISAATYQP